MLLTFIAFGPALHGGFIWDDPQYVTNNPLLRDAAGLKQIWSDTRADIQYYPLVFTTFWAEYHLWGVHPLGYHIDNVLLQAASAVLLWLLLRQLQVRAAFLAACVFAIHPVQVETVAWISERKNLLSGFFSLLAMLIYFRGKRDDKVSYCLALMFFFAAMLSKTVAATWPAAVLVMTWWKRRRIRRADVYPLIPFFIIGLTLGCLTAKLESEHVGATGKPWDFGIIDRCIISGQAIWFYAGKIFVPVNLSFIYPKWDLHSDRFVQLLPGIAVILTIAGLLYATRWFRRGPATAAMLFAGTLVPALGFVNVYPMRYTFVADHFQYLACIALIVPAAALVRRYLKYWAFLILLLLAVLSWRRCEVFADPIILWTDTVAKNPGSWMTHVNLGQAWEAKGRLDLAEAEYRAATIAEPGEAEAWWKLGDFQEEYHEPVDSEISLRQAIALDPDHLHARYDLARLLLDPNHAGGPLTDEGITQLWYVVTHDSKAVRPRVDLGWQLLEHGQKSEASAMFIEAMEIDPNFVPAQEGLKACISSTRPSTP
jgi:protein O-mannosyl-transferase